MAVFVSVSLWQSHILAKKIIKMYLSICFMILITIINDLDERLELSSINGMSDSLIPM